MYYEFYSYMIGRSSLHVYAGCGADPIDDIPNETYIIIC